MLALIGHCGELERRQAIKNTVKWALDREDYSVIEFLYADALAKQERTPSGLFVANHMVRILPAVWAPGDLPEDASAREIEAYWAPIEARIQRWADRFPDSVLPAIAASRAHVLHGWRYRGSGYASTVSPEGWRQLRLHVARAHDALMAKRERGRLDPNWYASMLEIARVQGWSEKRYRQLAQEAMDAFPFNYDIYFEISTRSVPQWGGSLESLASFADQAVKRSSKQEGESLYARIYWSSFHYVGPEYYRDGLVNWPRIRAGFEDVIKRYPDPWNLSFYARAACEAGDKPTTRRILERLTENDLHVLQWGSNRQRCRDWAFG